MTRRIEHFKRSRYHRGIVAGSLVFTLSLLIVCASAGAQEEERRIENWLMQDASKVAATPSEVSQPGFRPQNWYRATVPGTVLTTLVDNKVYPEPLYGENMREIPESLNKTDYLYRTSFVMPAAANGDLTWVHFAGVNYSARIWINGHEVGQIRGAFVRGDFEISRYARAGKLAVLTVMVSPEPSPGVPHEHTLADGVGKNGGDTAADGPTFLSTIGWDWLPAVRDRDTGIWLPVTVSTTGAVRVKDPFVTSRLDLTKKIAELSLSATLTNVTANIVTGRVDGSISGHGGPVTFSKQVTIPPNSSVNVALDPQSTPALRFDHPQLWWPNGYGPQNLYKLRLSFATGRKESSSQIVQFGIRKIEYQVPGTDNLTISVNGVKVMVRGGNWGLDEAMKRVPRERLEAQFHLHALANLNMIRNWVGQSTSPDFYDLADRYGMLLWDEFFQPNPNDGPDPGDIPTYIGNVTDKVTRYRNHPSIAVWCARNEGYPPKALDDQLKVLMASLDPSRLFQSNSADGRGVSSHGPYYWRSPRFFYRLNESFKTETGSVSVPTIESIQGMMPQKDWETINDDWAQHDLAAGAQRGDEYPFTLAKRYGPIRNLADFVRKAQLANYEAFRAMYEGRNSEMFKETSGIITWMSHPAQPSFVWQLYHYDLEPNASLYGVKTASEAIHVQLNEATGAIEVVNNTPHALANLTVRSQVYTFRGDLDTQKIYPVPRVPDSATVKAAQVEIPPRITPIYFIKLDLLDKEGGVMSSNFYWQNVAQDDFVHLIDLPTAALTVTAKSHQEGLNTILTVLLANPSSTIALMAHLQLHQKESGNRVLPVFYSDNYVSLVPGELHKLTIETATINLGSGSPLLLLDGFNVSLDASKGTVQAAQNLNATPSYWPPSHLVGERDR